MGIRDSKWVSLRDQSGSGEGNDSALDPNAATGVGVGDGVGVLVGAVVGVGVMGIWAQEAIRTIMTIA